MNKSSHSTATAAALAVLRGHRNPIARQLSRLASRLTGSLGADLANQVAILESRQLFAKAYVENDDGMPWDTRPYQLTSLESRTLRKIHQDARDVGKTSELIITALWASVCMPRKRMLIAAPLDNMLDPTMRRIRAALEGSPSLRGNLKSVRMSPSWCIDFKNGFSIVARIPGNDGLNFKGVHADWVLVDEAQDMQEIAWAELWPALNDDGRLWVYGVPNGIRNTYYRLCKDKGFERYHWPRNIRPDFSPARDAEMLKFYGGPDSPDYVHNVLGKFGNAAARAFYVLPDKPRHDPYFFSNDSTCMMNLQHLPLSGALVTIGVDVGFDPDPTEIVWWEDDAGVLVPRGRISLSCVAYPRQKSVIAALAVKTNAHRIVVDAGGPGLALVQMLAELGWEVGSLVAPLWFGSWVTLRTEYTGLELRGTAKEMITLGMCADIAAGKLVFNDRDPERLDQYVSQVAYPSRVSGRITYSKGNDHIIDADRCAFYGARFEQFLPSVEPAVFSPRLEGWSGA